MKKFCKVLENVFAPAFLVLSGVALAGSLFFNSVICFVSFVGLFLAGLATGLLFSDPDLYK